MELEQVAKALSADIARNMGERYLSTHYLESGSTSTVYQVKTDRCAYVLKISTPRKGKEASYESDFKIRELLFKQGLPVAKPVATDKTWNIDITANWGLDEYLAGSHPPRGLISQQTSVQLGSLLRVLHGFTTSGYGQLENSRKIFRGESQNAVSGLLTRFESPWPFTSDPLDLHPSIRGRARIKIKIQQMESDLLAFAESDTPALVHGDLHERQMLTHHGKLCALLDFNEVFIGSPEWDLGSYLYFHGSKCLDHLLDGYTEVDSERSHLKKRAKLASILIALHHGNRGVVLNRPHRIEASIRFLEETL